ncbi:hypothetical protein CQ476_50 [TM7 phage DolZOral124_53_65]|nr:hypothetical protein CQ476_50 [TM7 phage DolZOral124_53_65]
MGNKPFTWVSLFRDGHSVEQAGAQSDSAALQVLRDYIYGTPADPRRHYLLWFALDNGEYKFIVSFDRDGDAYISAPNGRMFMTEFKIRSAELVYRAEREAGQCVHYLGFHGLNTCGNPDGRVIIVLPDGTYTSASGSASEHAIMKPCTIEQPQAV